MWYDNIKECEEIIKGQGIDIIVDRVVSWGGLIYEEMMIGFIDYVYEVLFDYEVNNLIFGIGGGGQQQIVFLVLFENVLFWWGVFCWCCFICLQRE